MNVDQYEYFVFFQNKTEANPFICIAWIGLCVVCMCDCNDHLIQNKSDKSRLNETCVNPNSNDDTKIICNEQKDESERTNSFCSTLLKIKEIKIRNIAFKSLSFVVNTASPSCMTCFKLHIHTATPDTPHWSME